MQLTKDEFEGVAKDILGNSRVNVSLVYREWYRNTHEVGRANIEDNTCLYYSLNSLIVLEDFEANYVGFCIINKMHEEFLVLGSTIPQDDPLFNMNLSFNISGKIFNKIVFNGNFMGTITGLFYKAQIY